MPLVDDTGQLLAKRHIIDDAAATRSGWTCLPSTVAARRTDPSGDRDLRGLLVAVLRTGKRKVYAINPMAAARYRDRHNVRQTEPGRVSRRSLLQGPTGPGRVSLTCCSAGCRAEGAGRRVRSRR